MSEPTKLPRVSGYVRLGNSGLKVSRIILGGMTFGNRGWGSWLLEEEESLIQLKAAYDMGVNTWECVSSPYCTADTYSNGDSEIIIGKAIKKFSIPREELVILTKVHMVVLKDKGVHNSTITDLDGAGYVNQHGLSRKHIFDGIKASLERLQLDYVDVLQCHRFDYDTPIEETMDALHDVVKAGLARYIGMSSCHAYQFQQMQNYAKSKNQTQFISMQNFHNAIYREEEREMLPTCALFGVGCIPWSPLARGFLTRPVAAQEDSVRFKTDPTFGKFVSGAASEEAASEAINRAVEAVATARGLSMAQVALAWSLAQPGITAPIVGSTKLSSIIELVEATHVVLTEEEIASISAPYRPRPIKGHS